ncbi:DEAD/DEAH box helicase [Puniceicoccales bacterium CK1056]|uniref:DEAD/DEAH box helicase n=1 Tax=Oceanipulchritudo coccoides TaxID=2706888 RepID=A0A6B2LZL8_9BACT|nr:DEAD/DEAH box helicase [Oceanipulchritudo coccoides]NDV61384.1 DEAD/DEAH box helicase [Oceanipulchritudo coccoides]
MGTLDFPDFTNESLAEMGSWTDLREARHLVKADSVGELSWEHPVLSGEVSGDGQLFKPSLNLRSLTFIQNQCQCRVGSSGRVCAHALALCLAMRKHILQEESIPPAVPVEKAEIPEPDDGPIISSLKIAESGETLSTRFWLPPNLEAAAKRQGIVVKMEFLVGKEAFSPEKLFKGKPYRITENAGRILSFLERICGGSFYSVIQLKPDQLKFLIETADDTIRFSEGQGTPEETPLEQIRERILPMLPDTPPAQAIPSRGQTRRPAGVRRSVTPRTRQPVSERVLLPDNWMVVDGSPKFLSILLREREHPQYKRCADWLRSEGFRKEPSNGKWWLRDQHKVLNFLALNRERLEANYDPGYTENFRQRTAIIKPVPLTCETVRQGDQFSLRMEMKAEGIEVRDVRNALLTGRHYIVGDELIYLIEKAALEQFERASRSLGGDPHMPMTGVFEARLSSADLAHTEGLIDDLDLEIDLPDDWKKRSAAIREVGRLEQPPLLEEVSQRLRAYQLVGVAWMWHLYRNQLGGILADEMGLGKTIQAIGLLLSWKAEGEFKGPCLVVAPASLLGNWQRELSVWAPGLSVYLHHGPSRRSELDEDAIPEDLCLTSYSTLRNDRDQFQKCSFSLAIADEAQHVKNRRSHAARSLRSIAASSRFILTGTPIENSIEDLRALFDFCLPGYLKRPPSDLRGEDRSWHDKQHLEKAAPYILRRGKALVAPELPEKIEQTIWCELEPGQRDLYQGVREKTEQTLLQMAAAGASENRLRFTMLTELLRLRQVCADPGLLNPEYALEDSSKFRVFKELLSEAIDGGHRILVFSQFVKLLKRLRGWFEAEEIGYEYLDGSTRDRLAVCDRFNEDESISVCLISLKAGGTGLNLTGADTVVHFDPWWNPAVEDQATDRAHRIGQNRTVTSYKLVTEGTVEDKVLALQMKKSMLLKDLLDESAHQSAKVDLTTLKSLLS